MIPRSEYLRKLIHVANSLIPLAYLFVFPYRVDMLLYLGILTIIVLVVDLGRRQVRWIAIFFDRFFNPLLRQHELQGRLTGASWVFIGSWLTIFLFPQEIAVLSLLFLSLGDTAAALVGMRFGKTPIKSKSLEGFVGGTVVCLLVALLFPRIPWVVSFPGAVGAMIGELLPIPVDDNLRIPLLAGVVMVLIYPWLQ
ncbi:MAG: diacylglycerol/polyprenol kinase family protein [Fidelibacterota bacterium]